MTSTTRLRTKFAAWTLAAMSGLLPHAAAALDYGKPGEPIHLVVAHPCCYAEVWSVFANAGKELWKKYLPAGSTVEYMVGLQGAVVVNQMLAGKAHVGYMGDLPAFTATTKTQAADVRIVASTAMAYDQCYAFLVRKDAPEFKTVDEALKWVDGKTVATPKGSCTDDFVQKLFKRTGTEPSSYLNQNIEVISSGFKSGRLDAAAVWEPNASNLVAEGLARRVASGATIGEMGGGFVVMQADLIKQRPDVAKAWLEAELDAQLWMAEVKNAREMIGIIKSRVNGFTDKGLHDAIYGAYPKEWGGSDVRLFLPYAITKDVTDLVDRGVTFLKANKVINVDKLRDDAIEPTLTAEVLKGRGLVSPVGEVRAAASN
ncbi:ABC transporter substrate-binding protein [Hansschlegelia zhihuaiae]|uniref:Nitrate ABC transporter substrate-binding protein n=1 Tax=Hansschlegelia zhihuaiae TaxID=405005 RepID=A0A4Q0MIM8_9HYPH|nr:ABC transporter substrate-binding protein [Hansschlegelia zhihuaiae]RXF72796.1 nitrate ABC transporter substrate-binding protein [Hansschlegelia zhihuaiae]